MPSIIALIATAVIFGTLDAIWLNSMYTRLYQPEIGELLGPLRWGPALAFYVLYMIGIQIFAVAPALANGKWTTALFYGALFGFFCYATYDLTNHATMKLWSLKVTLLDIIWGTVATGAAAAMATAFTIAVSAPRGG